MSEPCPTCGRDVPTMFEHVDVQCERWPDRDTRPHGEGSIEYRDYAVSHAWVGGYQYVHNDYDGPEDGRCGHERTLEECYLAIDEALDA